MAFVYIFTTTFMNYKKASTLSFLIVFLFLLLPFQALAEETNTNTGSTQPSITLTENTQEISITQTGTLDNTGSTETNTGSTETNTSNT